MVSRVGATSGGSKAAGVCVRTTLDRAALAYAVRRLRRARERERERLNIIHEPNGAPALDGLINQELLWLEVANIWPNCTRLESSVCAYTGWPAPT